MKNKIILGITDTSRLADIYSESTAKESCDKLKASKTLMTIHLEHLSQFGLPGKSIQVMPIFNQIEK